MNMTRSQIAVAAAFLLSAMVLSSLVPPATGCPFCSEPTLTLAEQYTKADAAVLVQWVSGDMGKSDKPGSTTFEIVKAPRAPFDSIKPGKKIVLDRFRSGKKGDLALLMGSRLKGDVIEWGSPLDVTEASYEYIINAPSFDAPPEKRLRYYCKYLEFPEEAVATDAFGEFGNAPFKDVRAVAKDMPREKLRQWIGGANEPGGHKVPPMRLGVYGMMLGLCGNADDIPLMEKLIVRPASADEFRLGIDGVIGGYLLLAGEKGLDVVENSKIADKRVPFSETYAAMQALRFVWTYGNGAIPEDRLRASMRRLLDRPEIADLVIADLARWKDWSLQDQLVKMYGTEGYDTPTLKRSIIRYMIASTKDVPGGGGQPVPEYVTNGAKYLEQLRNRDPKMVSEAERYFY